MQLCLMSPRDARIRHQGLPVGYEAPRFRVNDAVALRMDQACALM